MGAKKFQYLLTLVCFIGASALHANSAGEYFTDADLGDVVRADSFEEFNALPAREKPYIVEIESNAGTNVIIRAHYFKAKNPKALVLGVHGLQSNGRWFKQTGQYLNSKNISLMVYDRRGSGLSDGNLTTFQKFLRLFNIRKDFDPNPDFVKNTDQLKGHARTGLFFRRLVFNAPKEFKGDIKAAYNKLVLLNKDPNKSSTLPVYVLANCFGSRISIPFAAENPGKVRGMFITAPATDMEDRANVTNLFKKADVATPLFHVIGPVDYIPTPLKDQYFIDRSNPAYFGIQDDSVSLSLRYATGDFFFATNKLHKQMLKEIPKMKIPMLIGLGSKDVMVKNPMIRARFDQQYQGPLSILTFNADHMLEFSAAGQGFAEAMNRWIDKDLAGQNPASFSNAGLPQLLRTEGLAPITRLGPPAPAPKVAKAAAAPAKNASTAKKRTVWTPRK